MGSATRAENVTIPKENACFVESEVKRLGQDLHDAPDDAGRGFIGHPVHPVHPVEQCCAMAVTEKLFSASLFPPLSPVQIRWARLPGANQ